MLDPRRLLKDTRTGATYPSLSAMPSEGLEANRKLLLEVMKNSRVRQCDQMLDLYLAWGRELYLRDNLTMRAHVSCAWGEDIKTPDLN